VEGGPYRRNKTEFLYFSDVVWKGLESLGNGCKPPIPFSISVNITAILMRLEGVSTHTLRMCIAPFCTKRVGRKYLTMITIEVTTGRLIMDPFLSNHACETKWCRFFFKVSFSRTLSGHRKSKIRQIQSFFLQVLLITSRFILSKKGR